jgi:tRNA pseudouridine38-40 synthase
VQGELERALATVLRVEHLAVTCAGRTDTGVHARGQVAHVDVEEADPERLRRQLDGVLPDDVRVRRVVEAAPGFDARFSAVWRRYAYRIGDRPEVQDPLTRGYVLAWKRPLDVGAIDQASKNLLGRHDFAAFCKRREGATTIRTLLDLAWERDADDVLVGTVRADAFCHHMVRSLVGCLVAVGEGRRPPEWAAEVLAAGTRDPAVAVVPAHGLTLEEVGYPPDDELAAQAEASRRFRTLEDQT